jgi:uncharacterized repeat protein (TIGR03803 family)
LHAFLGPEGDTPLGGLIQATDGNFYGTTEFGGSGTTGHGTVFRITPSGELVILHSFNGMDGEGPESALVQGSDGNFYGTTVGGGAMNLGTVFEMTPSGAVTTLASFDNTTNGSNPETALVQATDGNFYGTTSDGGAGGYGTIFNLTPTGALTTLHNFCANGGNCADGEFPTVPLVQNTNGRFFGTTNYGGDGSCEFGYGTFFSVALGRFVETQTPAGKVGATVNILGTELTGSTSVSFNGTPASFTVFSNNLILATVPADATTGKIQVVTPQGTLQSNVAFRVLQ